MKIQIGLVVVTLLMSSCANPAEEQARAWLAASDKVSSEVTSHGVHAEFEKVQLRVMQALAYASLGDVENVTDRLASTRAPGEGERRPMWASGGDGLVRGIALHEAIRGVNLAMLDSFGESGDSKALEAYLQQLESHQKGPDILFELGFRYGPGLKQDTWSADELAQYQMGVTRRLISLSSEKKALASLESIAAESRPRALRQQVHLLVMSGAFEEAMSLVRLANQAGLAEPSLLTDAITFAVRHRELETATALLDLADSKVSDEHLASIARSYVRDDPAKARQLFERAQSKTDRAWESVAWQIEEYDWLDKRFEKIADPWRRSERYYQLAKHHLKKGRNERAERLAKKSRDAARRIASDETRATAYAMQAGLSAITGDPKGVKAALDAMGESESLSHYRSEAQVHLAVAYARSNRPDRARTAALAISDEVVRVEALAQAARHSKDHSPEDYQSLVDVARREAAAIEDRLAAEKAWKHLVNVQVMLRDSDGVDGTLNLTKGNTHGFRVYDFLVEHYNSVGDFEAALEVAKQLPVESHERSSRLTDVVEAASVAGEVDLATKVLSTVSHQGSRELGAVPLAKALVESGKYDKAAKLLEGISRDDSQVRILGSLLKVHLDKETLPDPKLMKYASSPRGAILCFAVAASAKTSEDSMNDWLSQLPNPTCQAFAYAGAAYGISATVSKEYVFSLADPEGRTGIMEKGMGRAAILRR